MIGGAIFGFFAGAIGVGWGLMVALQPAWAHGLLTGLLSLWGRTWDDTLFVNFTRVVGAWMVVLGVVIIGVAIWLLLGGWFSSHVSSGRWNFRSCLAFARRALWTASTISVESPPH